MRFSRPWAAGRPRWEDRGSKVRAEAAKAVWKRCQQNSESAP
jgi:hypothetical protein